LSKTLTQRAAGSAISRPNRRGPQRKQNIKESAANIKAMFLHHRGHREKLSKALLPKRRWCLPRRQAEKIGGRLKSGEGTFAIKAMFFTTEENEDTEKGGLSNIARRATVEERLKPG
jgi:hypothetical protein